MRHSEDLLFFIKKLKLLKNNTCVEVGVRHGDNAEYLLSHLYKINLTLVDPYLPYQDVEHAYTKEEQDGICDKMLERIARFKDRVTFLRDPSVVAAEKCSTKLFDFVFIDAHHIYESCTEDIKAWYPLVRAGGALLGHDFSMTGVKLAVRDYFQEKNEGYMAWSLPAGDVWCMLKPE